MKKISILGSTGSVGTQTLDVIRKFPDGFKVIGLAAGRNIALLERQIVEFKPKEVSLISERDKKSLEKKFPLISFFKTPAEIAKSSSYQLLVSAISGRNGIDASMEALKLGKTLALAQKEVLVERGEAIRRICQKTGSKIIPIDSEHSAIFQSIGSEKESKIEKIILTCSGGPFFGRKKNSLKNIKPEEALAHPKWNMGKKISIDSATLMNKALEIIEAVHLFGIKEEKIEVVIHPEAKIHSGVLFEDGNVIFAAGETDIRIAISYALNFPERTKNKFPRIDFSQKQSWNFHPPDEETFPSLQYARKALGGGQEKCKKLNIANNEAVQLFLGKKIRFLEIFEIIEKSIL